MARSLTPPCLVLRWSPAAYVVVLAWCVVVHTAVPSPIFGLVAEEVVWLG